MWFGDLPPDRAEGAILAHTLKAGRLVLKKGRRLTAEDCAALAAVGVASVTAARLEPGDVHEDAAAARLGAALAGAHLDTAAPFTGRVNLFAAARGLAVIDRARLDRINRIDEALTVATLPEDAVVDPGQMVATVKVIPFAAPAAALAEAEALAAGPAPERVEVFARSETHLRCRLHGAGGATRAAEIGRIVHDLSTTRELHIDEFAVERGRLDEVFREVTTSGSPRREPPARIVSPASTPAA